MIRNYRDSTMRSTFRGTDQPPTRSALLTANWPRLAEGPMPLDSLPMDQRRRVRAQRHCVAVIMVLAVLRDRGVGRPAPPCRIAGYPRRHPGHRLGRRRDGLLRGTG